MRRFLSEIADEPDSLRGPQFDAAWCDELAKWRHPQETWDMLQFGLRLNAHHDRPGGTRAGASTGWVGQSKPVIFTELGCPAVDKGANQPNVFFDPKTSESFLPYFSSGARDDAMQRAYLEAAITYWEDDSNNPPSGALAGG